MWKKLTCAAAIGAVAVAGIVAFPRQSDARDPLILHDIHRHGHARFFAIEGETRRVAWTVVCRVPLRSCVARGNGVIVAIDAEGQPRLNTFAPPGARVASIRYGTITDYPSLLGAPLSPNDIAHFTRAGTMLAIDAEEDVITRVSLEGLSEVVDYLSWLKQAGPHGARDATAWPHAESALHEKTASTPISEQVPKDSAL